MSFSISCLSNMTNKELLNHLENIKHNSPIILELCLRLEQADAEQNLLNKEVECPVCMAKLNIDNDCDDNSFNLKVKK